MPTVGNVQPTVEVTEDAQLARQELHWYDIGVPVHVAVSVEDDPTWTGLGGLELTLQDWT